LGKELALFVYYNFSTSFGEINHKRLAFDGVSSSKFPVSMSAIDDFLSSIKLSPSLPLKI
jgi:hypothetical protein